MKKEKGVDPGHDLPRTRENRHIRISAHADRRTYMYIRVMICMYHERCILGRMFESTSRYDSLSLLLLFLLISLCRGIISNL